MMKRTAENQLSPRARLTGVVYLLFFLTAILAEYLKGRNLLDYSNVAFLAMYLLYIMTTILFYFMFKPINRIVSLIAALSSVCGCIICILDLSHLLVIKISPNLFFGPYCILIGYLIIKSLFLPRILGVMMVLAGSGWLLYQTQLVNNMSSFIEGLGIVAEASLMLWLVVKGVNMQGWNDQVGDK